MPEKDTPPLGTSVWERLTQQSMSIVIEDTIDNREIDTKPQEYVYLYRELKGKLGLAQLSFQDFDNSTQVASQFFSSSDFSELSPELAGFLDINKGRPAGAKVEVMIHHESEGDSWMSISHANKKVEFGFREIDNSVQGKFKVKNGDVWDGQEEISSDAVFEANKILSITNRG